jgi:hypothetical protein
MVTINSVPYILILEVEFAEENKVFFPEWINQPVEMDTNIWNKGVLIIGYTLRGNSADKQVLDQVLLNHIPVTLVDSTYGISGMVWVRRIEEEWQGDTNWEKPWLITLELVKVS